MRREAKEICQIQRSARILQVSAEEPTHALIRDLTLALQIRRLRGKEDKRARAQAEIVRGRLREIAGGQGVVQLQRSGPHLFVNRHRIPPRTDLRFAVQSLCSDLERFGIGGFEFEGNLDTAHLESFFDLYPRLASGAWAPAPGPSSGEPAGLIRCALVELVPGVRLLRKMDDLPPTETEEDLREGARRSFFLALAAARKVVRQSAARRLPELRISRSVVHELIDTLVGAEFSLIGMSAIQDFDIYTFQHSVHVSVLSLALGRSKGMSRRDLADLGVAALFHDLGKVHVPKAILQKPTPFDAQDWALVQGHPLAGARDLAQGGHLSDLAGKVMLVCAEHHLRHDGSGYPNLGEDWKPGLLSGIVSIADCFDAMTAARAYVQRPLTPDAVVGQMLERAGTDFDPRLLRLFVRKIGLFPVGSVLRLESDELGLVTEPPHSPREVTLPRVRLLRMSPSGWSLDDQRALADGTGPNPHHQIRATCHPLDLGLDVDRLLSQCYFPVEAEAKVAPTDLSCP